jgi:hypothetical protein
MEAGSDVVGTRFNQQLSFLVGRWWNDFDVLGHLARQHVAVAIWLQHK